MNRRTRGWPWSILAAAAVLGSAPTYAAQRGATTLYVSSSGSDATGQGTASAPFATIQHALEIAAPGATVVVEPGTYRGMVVITQRVTLESDPSVPNAAASTVIDASGAANGILLKGNGASGSVVRGLTIQNAQQAGILAVGPISHLTIEDNVVTGNDRGFVSNDPKAPFDGHCSDLPGGDCEALHLMAATDSEVRGNIVSHNLDGGIYLTDEFGPAARNLVVDNTVEDNQVDCGITLASHNPKGAADPAAGGVYDNVVADNRSTGNGAAGVVLATPLPGGAVYQNTVVNNTFTGNQEGGVVFHTHSPGAKVADNTVIANAISGNGADPDPGITQPVGISIAGMGSPISGLTIADNHLDNEYFGIWVSNAPNLQIMNNSSTNSVAEPYAAQSGPNLPTAPGGPSILWELTHHPVGYFGPDLIPLQRAADVIEADPALPSLFELTHHPVGYFGPNWIAAQQAAALLWKAGIHSRSQTGPLPGM